MFPPKKQVKINYLILLEDYKLCAFNKAIWGIFEPKRNELKMKWNILPKEGISWILEITLLLEDC
jgi:hypothetical protein